MTHRPIYRIAEDIRFEWKKVHFAAVPYLDAMEALSAPTDYYGCDSADNIVRYFLCNATTFRGPRAKELKAELKALFGIK